MNRPKLIVLFPNRFREFDWKRFDLSQLEKTYNFDIEVHDLGSVLFSKNKIFLGETFEKTLKFDNFKKWKKNFINTISENKDDIAVLNFIKVENLYSFLVNLELKKANIKILEFSSAQHPVPQQIIDKDSLVKKIFLGLRNPKVFRHFLILKLFTFFARVINLHPSHSLKCGSEGFLNHQYKQKTKIVECNAYDYSMFLNDKKNINLNSDNNDSFALFLETAGPLFPGDNVFKGIKMEEIFSKEKWFPSLTNFFDNLEELLNLKVKIAAHPRSNHLSNFPEYYGKREIVKERVSISTSKARILISRNSTGLAFGPIYKKPIIMVISNELKSYVTEYEVSKLFAKELGVNLINIDEKFEVRDKLKLFQYNQKKYEEYKKKYLTSRNDDKPNFEIFKEIIKEN